METNEKKEVIKDGYARIAREQTSCCSSSCCGASSEVDSLSSRIGYSREELQSVPDGADLGLGCGNPTAIASLTEGETVLDLGSGAGFDCFLAARRVGETGRVIGVDMTPEMVEKARENARRGGYGNVEFRLGDIENLPLGSESVDVVISNCVINLAPDKEKVFREAFRVLRPGGRFWISDLVLVKELPEAIRRSTTALVGCIAGAALRGEYLSLIEGAGFERVEVMASKPFPISFMENDPEVLKLIDDLNISAAGEEELASTVVSIQVTGRKPV